MVFFVKWIVTVQPKDLNCYRVSIREKQNILMVRKGVIDMSRRGENIRKRSDGRWEGRYTEHLSGKSKTHSVYARSYTAVREKLIAAKAAAGTKKEDRQELLEKIPAQITFHEAAEGWLEEIKKTKKYSTYVKYRGIYEKHIHKSFGSLPISDINSDILAKQMEIGISDSLCKSIYCVFHHIIAFASVQYQTPEIHLRRYVVHTKVIPAKILTISEQRKLILFLHQDMDRSKLGILICLSTGLRLGEICALKWSDIDMEAKILHVGRTVSRVALENAQTKTALLETAPKTACSRREIPISDSLSQILQRFQNQDTYLLNKKKPMDPRTYQNRFKSYLEAAGIEDTHFHVLRHTFATNCISNGADVKSVSEMLGHSDVKITLNRYVHPTVETKRSHMNTLSSIYGQYMGQISCQNP